MAGFLDGKERVVDMILTDVGRQLLASGELDFSFFTLSDHDVIYDPFISNSGSLTAEQLSGSIVTQVQESLVFEAISSIERLPSPLFTMPQGQTALSRVVFDTPITSGTITVTQRKEQSERSFPGRPVTAVDLGFKREGSSNVSIDLSLADFFPLNQREGFVLRALLSGSDGTEVSPIRRDASGLLSISNDVIVTVDDDVRQRQARLAEKDREKLSADFTFISLEKVGR